MTDDTAPVDRSPSLRPATSAPVGRPLTDPISGHRFTDPSLYQRALTHPSASFEAAGRLAPDPTQRPGDNQQMEFLGDAILSLVVARELFFAHPAAREGDLSRMRASIVSRDHLAAVATRLRLGRFLRLGRGEERSGGRAKPALLADAMEALIAAIYLDAGLPAASLFITREILRPGLAELQASAQPGAQLGDFKTTLQERLQAENRELEYVLLDQAGPDHQRVYRVAVEVAGPDGSRQRLAEGQGSSKKRAQQEAARLTLELLDAPGVLDAPAPEIPRP